MFYVVTKSHGLIFESKRQMMRFPHADTAACLGIFFYLKIKTFKEMDILIVNQLHYYS
jgi:hypothetical protein